MNLLSQLAPLKNTVEQFFKADSFIPSRIGEDFSLLRATVRGELVVMESKAWHSSFFRYIRLTYLTSQSRIEMLNLTLYPQTHFDAPVFATDIVALNGKLRVGVIDAMPLFPNELAYASQWIAPFAALHQQSLQLAPVYDRKLEWSFHYLSPCACLATQLPAERFGELFALWQGYFDCYFQLISRAHPVSPQRAQQVKHWQATYDKEHYAIESKRNPLMHYFGQTMGLRYLREFLFTLQQE